MPDGIKLTMESMTRRDWAILKESLPALGDRGNPFEWSLKLLAYFGPDNSEHGNRVSRKVWKALAEGPRTFGPFCIRRAGRNRIAFVSDQTWGQFRSIPRESGGRLSVAVAPRTDQATPWFALGEMKPRDWRLFADCLPEDGECNELRWALRAFVCGSDKCGGNIRRSEGEEYKLHRELFARLRAALPPTGGYRVGVFRVARAGAWGIAFYRDPSLVERRKTPRVPPGLAGLDRLFEWDIAARFKRAR